MDKLTISINLELRNDAEGIAALTRFIEALRGVAPSMKVETREAPAPALQTALTPGEDLPAAEPEPVAIVSDDTLVQATRAAVARLKAKGLSTTLIRKDIFAKYGIGSSVECPQDKRAALVAELDKMGV